MKVTIGTIEREETPIDYVLKFENGLKLRTYLNLPFAGEQARNAARQQLEELFQKLEQLGFELEFSCTFPGRNN